MLPGCILHTLLTLYFPKSGHMAIMHDSLLYIYGYYIYVTKLSLDDIFVITQQPLLIHPCTHRDINIIMHKRMSIYMLRRFVLRPESIMLENLPKILLGIYQKFPILCLDSFLLCSIMLTVITAVSYVYTNN